MRVLLATDRPHLGDALSFFLGERHVDVVAVAGDAHELLELALSTHPVVVLVDWQLAETDPAGILADLKRCEQPAHVIVMCSAEERPLAQMAAADGYVTLGDPPEALLDVLRDVTITAGR